MPKVNYVWNNMYLFWLFIVTFSKETFRLVFCYHSLKRLTEWTKIALSHNRRMRHLNKVQLDTQLAPNPVKENYQHTIQFTLNNL
jgi:hypothetical protein